MDQRLRKPKYCPSDNTIKQNAERLWTFTTEEHTAPKLHLSNGGLHKFRKMHGFRQISYHGEQASAAFTESQRALPLVRVMFQGYNLDEIYDADEFGLQYRLAPNNTIAATQLSGSKKDKARITCLACRNASGSDVAPLRIIGNALSPRAFRGKSEEGRGFDYRSNAKASMTKAIFEWHHLFNSSMLRTGRRAILLLDNCSDRTKTEVETLNLSSTKIIFLPPNTTSMT